MMRVPLEALETFAAYLNVGESQPTVDRLMKDLGGAGSN